MKISFLVTYFNQEKYVYQSLNSIYNLTLDFDYDYEVLVGDDGSTDNTLHEVEKWYLKFGEKISVISGDRDDGVVDNVERASQMRKRLLFQSTGEYFCILDGDDYYCDKSFITDATSILEKNQDISIVMFSFEKFWENDNKIEECRLNLSEGKLITKNYIERYYITAGACVFRKYEEFEKDESLINCIYYDDNDIVIYNLKYGDIWYVDRVVYRYRQGETSLWNSLSRAQQGVLNMIGADVEAKMVPQYQKEIYFTYMRDVLYNYFRKDYLHDVLGEKYYREYSRVIEKIGFGLAYVFFNYECCIQEDVDKVLDIIEYLKYRDLKLYTYVAENVQLETSYEKSSIN